MLEIFNNLFMSVAEQVPDNDNDGDDDDDDNDAYETKLMGRCL